MLLVLSVAAMAWRSYVVARSAALARLQLEATARARGRMRNPPTTAWATDNSFCTFLSHYKEEAGSDARYLRDLIQSM